MLGSGSGSEVVGSGSVVVGSTSEVLGSSCEVVGGGTTGSVVASSELSGSVAVSEFPESLSDSEVDPEASESLGDSSDVPPSVVVVTVWTGPSGSSSRLFSSIITTAVSSPTITAAARNQAHGKPRRRAGTRRAPLAVGRSRLVITG